MRDRYTITDTFVLLLSKIDPPRKTDAVVEGEAAQSVTEGALLLYL